MHVIPPRLRRDERGTSLVEFALVLPVFALLLFGMIDFGLCFGGFITLESGISAGARNAAVGATSPACRSAANPMLCTVQDDIGSLTGVVPGSLEIAITFPGGPVQGQPVRVCARASLTSTTGLTAPFLGGRAIHALSVSRLEQTPTYASVRPAGFSC